MLDLSLFRRPAFTGASIVAFTLSSSIFAMFLYLTLYIQDVLGYGPLQAGLRFLPITLLSFARGADRRQADRAGAGPHAARHRPAARVRRPARDDRRRRRTPAGRCCPRLRARRRGHRPRQPAARLRRDRRGAPRAQRNGLGHQQHLPPGRDRDRDRRPRRGLPAQRHAALARGARRLGPRRAGRSRRPTDTSRRCCSPARSRTSPARCRPARARRCRAPTASASPTGSPRSSIIAAVDRAGRLGARLRARAQPRLRRRRRARPRRRGGDRRERSRVERCAARGVARGVRRSRGSYPAHESTGSRG